MKSHKRNDRVVLKLDFGPILDMNACFSYLVAFPRIRYSFFLLLIFFKISGFQLLSLTSSSAPSLFSGSDGYFN